MAKEVLARVQRSPEDAKELRPLEKKEEKGEEKEEKEPHGANSVIESINGDLDNFLAMYEDESDEEEEDDDESRVSVRSTEDLLSFTNDDGIESLRRTGTSSSSSTISSDAGW